MRKTVIKRNCTADAPPRDYEHEVQQALATVADNPLPLGDWTAASLEALGITKERWNAWKGEVGPCQACVDRQKWWNELGRKVVDFHTGS